MIGFGAGVLWRSFFDLGFSFSIFLLLLGAATLFLFFFVKVEKRDIFLLFSLFLILSSFGVLRFDLKESSFSKTALDSYLEKEVQIEAIVVEEVEKGIDNTEIIAFVKEIRGKKIEDDIKISIFSEPFVSLEYGDSIRIKGKIKKPKNFKSENGRVFNYVSYLEKDGIFYQMFYPEIEKVKSGGGNFLKRNLFKLKSAFLKKAKEIIPSPESDLLGGVLLGSKGSLGDDLQRDFRKTGLIHIVVLSGYNITIVAKAVSKVASFFFAGTLAAILSALSIFCFAILTGASATVIRASIMALLVILARLTIRDYAIMRALFFAGFLMIFFNPYILAFDPSFQLSFTATLGLIVLSPYIERIFSFITEKWGLREIFGATISTQIFVLPIILYMMGELSIVSVPVNLLVLVTVPASMLFGFLAGSISFLSSIIAVPFAHIAYFLFAYQMKVVNLFASFSFSSLKIESFSIWLVILIYILYALFIYKFIYNRDKKL